MRHADGVAVPMRSSLESCSDSVWIQPRSGFASILKLTNEKIQLALLLVNQFTQVQLGLLVQVLGKVAKNAHLQLIAGVPFRKQRLRLQQSRGNPIHFVLCQVGAFKIS